MRYTYFLLILLSLGLLIYLSSCDKTSYATDPDDKLLFSVDTLQFDTIFSSIGSTTKYFQVYNPSNTKAIIIDKVYLAKQNQSNYRININGNQAILQEDITIPPGDSIFVFVEVTIDPGRNEMIEHDSIIFITNNNIQDIDLVAFGQDVVLINGNIIYSDTIWTNTKPVLIYNSALVDTFASLTIESGTNVYFHKGSSLFVKGTLTVNGTTDQPVSFLGDRLESSYSEIPGQWGAFNTDENNNVKGIFGGIHLLAGSRYNQIDNAIIKNGIIGLQVDSVVTPGTPSLVISNTTIENMNVACLYALGAHVEAHNCVFANAGQYTLACVIGGKYSFIHCTMANYWTGNRQSPQLILNNYYTYSGNSGQSMLELRDLTQAYFGNCIIYGNKELELGLDLVTEAEANFFFDHCIIKSNNEINTDNPQFFNQIVLNQNPKFINISSPYDYHLDTLSPAKDAGDALISSPFPLDKDGQSRLTDNNPDLGAYERIE
ncbi:MAG TPA: hypothetical protein PLO05_06695 [Bacteroidales bacterium]|nr:hypothetical protein [Bacteroidales bacterium]